MTSAARPLDDALYHATLAEPGESHIGHLGPLVTTPGRERGYLVLTSRRLIFVRTPSVGRRKYEPRHEVRLDAVRALSSHEGRVTTVFTVNDRSYSIVHVRNPVKPYTVTGFRDLVATTRERYLRSLVSSAAGSTLAPTSTDSRPIVREREVVTEIVKVPCRFCGALISLSDPKCSACGAPIAR